MSFYCSSRLYHITVMPKIWTQLDHSRKLRFLLSLCGRPFLQGTPPPQTSFYLLLHVLMFFFLHQAIMLICSENNSTHKTRALWFIVNLLNRKEKGLVLYTDMLYHLLNGLPTGYLLWRTWAAVASMVLLQMSPSRPLSQSRLIQHPLPAMSARTP